MKSLLSSLLFSTLLMLCSCGTSGESPAANAGGKGGSQQNNAAKNTVKAREIPVLDQKNAVAELTRYGAENPETKVRINTRLGQMEILLYEDTPLHRANFIMLIKRGYYDQSLFYRVIRDFVVQGGDSDDLKFRDKKRRIGKYLLPAEIAPERHFHKKGALAAAREYEKNPEKQSASFDFYLVKGTRFSAAELQAVAREHNLLLTEEQRRLYTILGGTPHLDGQHTVFGEVVSGLEVIDRIAELPVGEGDWPQENVEMTIEIIR